MARSYIRKVGFTYIGSLRFRGRMLKQIATLQQQGIECCCFLGQTGKEAPSPKAYAFPIATKRVRTDVMPLVSLWTQGLYWLWAARRILEADVDGVVCVSLGSVMAGVLAKRRRPSLRLVFDNNELSVEYYPRCLKRFIFRRLQNYALRFCDVVIHAEPNRLKYFAETYAVPPGRPQMLLENYPYFEESVGYEPPSGGNVRVIYLGEISSMRFSREVADAFLSMPDTFQLDMVGYGHEPSYIESIRERIAKSGRKNVRVLPPVAYAEIPELLSRYHIGLAFYRNLNLNLYYCAPNKVYDYLMKGMPVISNDYPGLVRVLDAHAVGCCIDAVTADALHAAMDRLMTGKYWANITSTLRRQYSWEAQADRYLALFADRMEAGVSVPDRWTTVPEAGG